MDKILLSKDEFHFLLLLLKYIDFINPINSNSDKYIINALDLRNFLMKNLITSIEIKNRLFQNFFFILKSTQNSFYSYTEDSNILTLTKNQICTFVKPVLESAIVNPFEKNKLVLFFEKFNCQNSKEVFIELLSP
jgi:hypothetical protein